MATAIPPRMIAGADEFEHLGKLIDNSMGLLGQHANSPILSELDYCRLAETNNPLSALARHGIREISPGTIN